MLKTEPQKSVDNLHSSTETGKKFSICHTVRPTIKRKKAKKFKLITPVSQSFRKQTHPKTEKGHYWSWPLTVWNGPCEWPLAV